MALLAPTRPSSGDDRQPVDSAPVSVDPVATEHATAWIPGLDGLRGVAVMAVLAFHGGYDWAKGGYLGVSVFFTLSGFLMASILFDSLDRSTQGPVRSRLGRFWARRVRRLAPAQLAVLVGIVVATVGGALPVTKPAFTGDVLAGLGQIANWRFVATESDYGALFRSPSPVLHLWSLAVEVQLYLVFPVIVVVLGRRRSRHARSVGLFAVIMGLAAVTVLVPMSSARLYYGTDVRAVEFCAGALLAALLSPTGDDPSRLSTILRSATARRLLTACSVGAAVLLVVAFARLGLDQLRIDHLHLAVIALASSIVIAAAATRTGPVAGFLAWSPLRWLGNISYGVYLVHWPLFLALTPNRLGWSDNETFGLRIAATLAAAIALRVVVERPVRRRHRTRPDAPGRRRYTVTPITVPPNTVPAAALASVLLIIGLAILGGRTNGTDLATSVPDFGAAVEALPTPADVGPRPGADVGLGSAPVDRTPDSIAPDRAITPTAPLRLMVAGDSQAVVIALGLTDWQEGTGFEVASAAAIGCGIGRGGEVRYHSVTRPIFDDCPLWAPGFVQDLLAFDPDVIVIASGPWDFSDRRLPGDDTWRMPGDPIYDDYLAGELDAANERLAAADAPVVWLTAPPVDVGRLDAARPDYASAEPERSAGLNALIAESAARHGAIVLDLVGFLSTCPGGVLDPDIRPDGVHLSYESTDMVAEWLGPELYEAAGARPPASTPFGEARQFCSVAAAE